jgi:hypothetical protein
VEIPSLKDPEAEILLQRIQRNITKLKAATYSPKSLGILNVSVFPAVILQIYFLYKLRK